MLNKQRVSSENLKHFPPNKKRLMDVQNLINCLLVQLKKRVPENNLNYLKDHIIKITDFLHNLQNNGLSQNEKKYMNLLWDTYNTPLIYRFCVHFSNAPKLENELKHRNINYKVFDAYYGWYFYIAFENIKLVSKLIDENDWQKGISKDYFTEHGNLVEIQLI